jgi:DNA-binding NarL/FixJ family response regulator
VHGRGIECVQASRSHSKEGEVGMEEIRLVVADSHPLVLDGLEFFCSQQKDMLPVARCMDGKEAVQAVRQHRPDILLLDVELPGMDGLAVLRQLRQDKIPTKAVLLTVALDDKQALEALRLGVRGVVLKTMTTNLLAQCIRKVHAGEQWLEKQSAGRAIEKMLLREAGARKLANILTSREIEVMEFVAKGLGNREIAARLTMGEGTVKTHLYNIYKKLGVNNRVDLTLYAQKKGLVS